MKTKEVQFSETFTQEGPSETIILGKVIKIISPKDVISDNQVCEDHHCFVDLEIVAILNYGSDYNGQYNSGDVVRTYFEFTLDNTARLFPEFNEQLPGLNVGDCFEAPVYTNNSEAQIKVRMYKVKI